MPSAFCVQRETCFRARGWSSYSRGRGGVSASCRKNYMIAGIEQKRAGSSPPTLFCSFLSSFGLENMISFVPGVCSGVTAEKREKGVVVVRTLRTLWMTVVPSRVSIRRHFPWNGLHAAAFNSRKRVERLYGSVTSFYRYL